MAEPVYGAVLFVARSMTASMGWKVIIRGEKNLPDTGPVVLAINHAGYLDFVFAAWASVFEKKRYVRYLAKKEIFDHPIAGPLMRGMKHIPVDRKKDPAKALDLAIEVLQRGEVIGTFPEATINPSFVPSRGKTGTVRMAQASGATIIPVAVWGAHRILTKWRPRNLQRKVAILVNIGEPFPLSPGDDPREATDRLMASIRELLTDAQEQYPQKPAGEDDLWWIPVDRGGTAPTPEEAAAMLAVAEAERAAKKAAAATPEAVATPSAPSAAEPEAAATPEEAPPFADAAPTTPDQAPEEMPTAPEGAGS